MRVRCALRGVAALGLVGLSVVGQPRRAAAAPEDWAGSEATWAQATDVPNPVVSAHFVRSHTALSRLFFTSQLVDAADPPKGCDTSVGPNSPNGTTATDVTTSAEALVTCNGVYDVAVTAELRTRDTSGNWTIVADSHTLTGQMAVSAPPPQVTGLQAAKGDGRTVTLRWDDLSGGTPDLAGYEIERAGSNGKWTVLATAGASTTSFTDDSPPDEGGDIRYRVSSKRPRADGALEVGGAQEETARGVAAAPAPPTTASVGSGGSGSGSSSAVRTPSSVRRSPRVATPTRRAPSITPTTDGGTYELELPYDDLEPGEEAAVLPDDLTSGDRPAGAGLVIPLAIAMVLALWAVHLRFLTRLGRPVTAQLEEMPPAIGLD